MLVEAREGMTSCGTRTLRRISTRSYVGGLQVFPYFLAFHWVFFRIPTFRPKIEDVRTNVKSNVPRTIVELLLIAYVFNIVHQVQAQLEQLSFVLLRSVDCRCFCGDPVPISRDQPISGSLTETSIA